MSPRKPGQAAPCHSRSLRCASTLHHHQPHSTHQTPTHVHLLQEERRRKAEREKQRKEASAAAAAEYEEEYSDLDEDDY